ncbi:hypothetical protein [Roseovarius sp. 2305UL8-3]|uniref:hypothetical protein n=1 Tax=Roseovarius conchicola TaxID=3121636 RepID=UPI00352982F6
MGLDQYAYINTDDEAREPDFYWRKHARLQEWAERLFAEKTGGSARELNCGELPLNQDDIAALEGLLTGQGLPTSEGGFFYGHQLQEERAEAYAAQDAAFCEWAKRMLSDGQIVIYSCWW